MRVRVLAHLLASGADYHPDLTFSVFRAGIGGIQGQTWPVVMPVAVVTRLELTAGEAGKLQMLQFRISHEGNEVGSSPPQPLAVRVDNPNIPIYVNAISNLALLIPGPGRLTISATINEAALPPLYLIAQQAPT
jgi:hypothetical protein